MPSLGFGEILVILLIALIIFGPKRLPEMGRTVGKSLKEFRKAAADLRAELDADLEEDPPVSNQMRAGTLAEKDTPGEPEPSRGEAPPT